MTMKDNKNNKVINIKKGKDESDQAFHSKFGNYKADEELIQSTARIKNQRDVILDRIKKMDQSLERVSRSVYDKVRRDYALQLQTITDLLNEKKETLRKEIKELYIRREKLTVEINRHKEILEEADFRQFLGEFSQSQFQEVENYETKEIEKLETDLSHINQLIRSHEELFDPEDLGLPKKEKQPEVTKTVAPRPQPQRQPEPKKYEEPQEISEVNEFEALFTDDESENESLPTEAESNLDNIISDEENYEIDLNKKPSPKTESEDYYSEDKVNESSFTVKKSDFQQQISSDDLTPKPQKLEEEIITSTSVKKPGVTDDSISDILDSINIEESAKQEEAKEEHIPIEAPVKQGNNYVLTLTEGDLDQNEFPLKENTSIGRSSSNDIVLKAPKVSRQHAAINMYNNQFIIIDLKSSNGVYVNGAKVDECVLNIGDEVSVGGYKFIFEKK